MSFEEVARRAGHDLREARGVDVEAAFAEFQRAVPVVVVRTGRPPCAESPPP